MWVRVCVHVCVCVYVSCTCIGYCIAANATCDMQSQCVVRHEGRRPECFDPMLRLHITCGTRHYAITFLLYGAACPSSLSSLTMGEIDLLVSQIPASVFFFSGEKDSRLRLASHNFI